MLLALILSPAALSICSAYDLPEVDDNVNPEPNTAAILLGWDPAELPLRYAAVDSPLPSGITTAEFKDVVDASFAAWSSVSDSNLVLITDPSASGGSVTGTVHLESTSSPAYIDAVRYVDGVSRIGPPHDDGLLNVVAFVEEGWQDNWGMPPDALGVTIYVWDPSQRTIEGADIILNASSTVTWGILTPPADESNVPTSAYDLQNTITHEAGHFIGLAHPPLYRTESTMYYQAPAGEVKKRTLDQDDINGVWYLYGVSGVPIVQPDRNTIGLKYTDSGAANVSDGSGGGCSLARSRGTHSGGGGASTRTAEEMQMLGWFLSILSPLLLLPLAGRRPRRWSGRAALAAILLIPTFFCPVSQVCRAATMPLLPLERLVDGCDAAVEGWVERMEYVAPGEGPIPFPTTCYEVRVERVLYPEESGELRAGGVIRVYVHGGRLPDGRFVRMIGSGSLIPGEKAVLLLRRRGASAWMPSELAQSIFHVELEEDGTDGAAEEYLRQEVEGICPPPRTSGKAGGGDAASRYGEVRITRSILERAFRRRLQAEERGDH